MSALQIAWFVLIGVLVAGYMILDGYDLGIGFWHLFARSSSQRSAMRSAIAPYWDANEVWLITAGGALFAAFPMVYATVFSGLYLALMLVVFALIFRGISIDYVAHASGVVKKLGEAAFGIGSVVAALLFGVAAGNILQGLPLDANDNYTGTFLGLLNGFSLLVGVTGLALFAMHGALFLQIRAQGDVVAKAKKWALSSWAVYLIGLITCYFAAHWTAPDIMTKIRVTPFLWGLYPFLILTVVGVGILVGYGRARQAFICSTASIAALTLTLGAALYPNLVTSRDGGRALTIADSSSSELTLAIMFGVATIGMALVIIYTIWVRKAFAEGSVEY